MKLRVCCMLAVGWMSLVIEPKPLVAQTSADADLATGMREVEDGYYEKAVVASCAGGGRQAGQRTGSVHTSTSA